VEFFRLLHHAQGLAVALRPRHAKVAAQVFFQRGSLAVAQNGNGHPVETRDPAQNSSILFALPVAALLKKISKQIVDDFGNMRAVRAAGQKDAVLRRQGGAALQKRVFLRGKLGQFGGVGRRIRHFVIVSAAAQRVDLRVQRF